MEFKNIEKFEAWLNEVAKRPLDLRAVLEEVRQQYFASGPEYELRGFFTKSGNPECYNYDVEETFDEETDNGETTIIF